MTEFVVKPLLAEITLFIRNPFLQPAMRLDRELAHPSLLQIPGLCASRCLKVIRASLLDDLVGIDKNCIRHSQAKCLCGPEVYDRLEPGGRLDR